MLGSELSRNTLFTLGAGETQYPDGQRQVPLWIRVSRCAGETGTDTTH